MALSLQELQMEFQKLQQEKQEGRSSFESIFRFLELAISTYQERQQQEDWDDDGEAIFDDQNITIERDKGGKEMENLEPKKATKKGKNKMKNRYNVRKQQKREIQQRGKSQKVEFERWGGKKIQKIRFEKKGKEKGKRSHKGVKQDEKKKAFFRDNG